MTLEESKVNEEDCDENIEDDEGEVVPNRNSQKSLIKKYTG